MKLSVTLSNSDPFLWIDNKNLQSALFHKRVGFPGDHLNAHNVQHTGGSQRWLNRDCVCDGGAPLSWPFKRICFRENSGRRTSSYDVLPEATLPLVSPMVATPEASHFCPMQEALADSLGLGTPHQPGWVIPRIAGQSEALSTQASFPPTPFSHLHLHLGLRALLLFPNSFPPLSYTSISPRQKPLRHLILRGPRSK